MNKERRRFTSLTLGRVNLWEGLGLLILVLYPLRHINWGLDLWDTGYNYANFQYFGTEHMDPMWFFSTYLANAAGSLLMRLPGSGALIGMNFYTGLLVSILAAAGYFFCTRKLGIPKILAFAGELTAISLCWCPTALIYNYATYVLFLFSVILLYVGLVKERKACLVGAGALLGANVLVRFSNLPEAAMILSVWAYDFIIWRQENQAKRSVGPDGERSAEAGPAEGSLKREGGSAGTMQKNRRQGGTGSWPRPLGHSFWCLTGYLAALAVLLGFIHIRYGIGEYVSGIQRLFAMTDNAVDYKPSAMIMGLVGSYVENLYWVIRIMIILAGGMLLAAGFGWLACLCGGKRGKSFLHTGIRIVCILIGAAMLGWLYYRKFCSLEFTSYDSMLRPGILFLMLTMFIGAVRIFSSGAKAEEKLISGMLILIILLTSLGSNNGIYPSLNNLFLAAPYTFWQSWRFLRYVDERRALLFFPAKALLASFLAMCMFQFAGFGAGFVFAEATGVQDAVAYVENNDVLKNVKMSPEKARWVGELSVFVDENGLKGREVILYGSIPALSYYLQMPSAFNPWSDLDSYSREVMEEELKGLAKAVAEGMEKPVVIIENTYVLYGEGGLSALAEAGVSEKTVKKMEGDLKWSMLWRFMGEMGYERVFRNEKFAVYR